MQRLRLCWLSFGELAQAAVDEFRQVVPPSIEPIPQTVIEGVKPTAAPKTTSENGFGQQLSARHRQALDEIVSTGELTRAVAELVQEAYDAAVYHVWRSNAPITCYAPVIVNYAPVSADTLVRQSEVVSELASQGNIDPQTLANAQAAIEHDMAFYALTDAEVNSLYDHLIAESQSQSLGVPAFENVELEITQDARAAAMMRTTTAATIFHAGTKSNVLPPEARAVPSSELQPRTRTKSPPVPKTIRGNGFIVPPNASPADGRL